ncbi:unnamed protein product [Amoebophrya sp. A25]|nr:unnamed protein product [Amoebophrya sp. A25]|eukprot:GSA25T00014713001.1
MKMFKRGLVVHRHLQLLLLFAFEEEVTLFTCSSVLASSSILRPSHLTPPLADDFDYMARDLQQPKKDDENDLANILQAYSSEAAAQERSAGPPHLHMYNTHEGDPVEDYQNFRSFQQVYGIHLVQRHLEEKDEMKKRARGSLRWIPNTSNPKNQPDTGRRREEQERTSPKSFGGREQASRRSTAEDVDAARTGKILASTLLASTLSGTDSNASDSSRLDSGTSASSISGPVRLEEDYMMNDAQDEVVLSGATSRRAVENDLPTSANVTIQDEHADVDGEVFDHVEEEEEQEILEDAAHLRDVPLRKHHEVETTRLMRLKMCLGRSIFSLLEKTALVGGLIETQLLDCCGERVKSREHAVYLALKKALSEALTLGFGVGKLAWADLLEEVESRGGVQKMADKLTCVPSCSLESRN